MVIKNGSKGENVRKIQEKLVLNGYKIKADGDFGAATESAVMSFQTLKGLTGDGQVGPKTLAALGLVLSETDTKQTPSGKRTILVSAGHSTVPPRDPGASGNGYTEAREAVRLRDAIAVRLRAKNFRVLEDGEDGISDPLKKAIALARTADESFEIHFNGSENRKATGIEVLAKRKNRVLAQKICKAIADATGLQLRGGDGGFRPDDSGQHERLGFCEAGGLVVEICFISNPDDMRAYSENFEKIVENIANVFSN